MPASPQPSSAPPYTHAPLRSAIRAIFETCYPGDDWSPVPFEEAERLGTVHYRQAVEAAKLARAEIVAWVNADAAGRLELIRRMKA